MGETQTGTDSLRAARLVSAVVAALMAVSSAVGLWIPDLYRDSPEIGAELRAYDLVTLLLATPLLVGALVVERRGSAGARLVWLGLLMYAGYNYAIYVFGSSFNDMFLVHVALLPLTVAAAVLLFRNFDAAAVRRRFRPGTPVRSISVVLMLLGLGLAGMWVFYSLRFAVTGALPDESQLVLPMPAVHLAYVLDLAFFAPACVLASVLLWLRDSWGFVLATAVLVFGALYQVNYVVALVFQARAGIAGARGFDPAEPFVVGVLLVALVAMAVNLRRDSR
ncbi:hypothetical protein [Lentzea aerocolonigenes]|uniref:hypothetical protein n=1 Tax=Lentzea aerocolonigenes TaxID=68170 RepID=UPI0004C336C4|nr:hypothetical protein [Lentzea aerocolonigenes]MCP2247282.1 hypothetical protein [Lentzea aerocolonigenes]